MTNTDKLSKASHELLSSCKIAEPVLFINEKDRPRHTEGAIWNEKRRVLYCVDVLGKKVFQYSPSLHKLQQFNLPEDIGTAALTKGVELLVALQSGIGLLNSETGSFSWKIHFNNNATLRSNDGRCSPEGRFWFGTMGYNPDSQKNAGSLYRLDPDYKLTTIFNKSVTISNGIVWNKEGTKMYYIDTPTNQVDEFIYNKKQGTIENRKAVIKAGEIPGFFDGSAMDADGMIWIALWGGEGVGRYDPHSGKLLEFIKTPEAKQASSCTFGGDDLCDLYITTSRDGLTDSELKEQSLAGAVFKIKMSVMGLPAYYFG